MQMKSFLFCLFAVLKSQAKGFENLEILRSSLKIYQLSPQIMQLSRRSILKY